MASGVDIHLQLPLSYGSHRVPARPIGPVAHKFTYRSRGNVPYHSATLLPQLNPPLGRHSARYAIWTTRTLFEMNTQAFSGSTKLAILGKNRSLVQRAGL